MKKIELFYLSYCPHCKKAFRLIDELKAEDKKYADIKVTMLDEAQNEELSNSKDYHYVPCFYVDDKKEHEGVIEKNDVKRVFECALKK